jgi:serpin B
MRYLIFPLIVFPLFSYAQDYKSVVRANNAFAFDLYYEASQKSDFLLSPVSISSAVAMTYAGARGETKGQIKHVFHFPDDEKLNNGSFELSNILQQPHENSTLAIANKLWAGKGRIALDSSFVNLNKKYYSAALQTLNFGDPSATKIVNDWVAVQTKDKIKNLLDPDFISSDLILILTNAVYFKSSWQDRFDSQNTVEGKFTTEKDNKIDALFMTQRHRNYAMWQNEFVNMIELPFANNEFSLDILLPINNMGDLEENFLVDDYEMWLTKAYKVTFTTVQIPKFRTNFKIELLDALTDMGMGKAFAVDADFGGIGHADGPIRISKVVHETFMEVNEDGAEASAATAIGMATRSLPVDHQFIADHPFIYILRHIKTNTILFIGKMSNPSY